MTAVLAPGALLADRRMRPRTRALAWAAVVLGALVLVLVVRRPSGEGRPLDPEGTGRLGARALVLLLREGGADVQVSARPPTADRRTALVLEDTFDDARNDAITAWVRAGGTLVVADPTSSLNQVKQVKQGAASFSATAAPDTVRQDCPAIAALGGIATIRTGGGLPFDRKERAPGAVGCFSSGPGDWLVATPLERGRVIALAGAGPFVNANLARADAAGLAMALLAPVAGTPTQIVSDQAPDAAALGAPATGDDDGTFSGLPAGARVAGAQLLVAFAGLALWRGRRLGRPVAEDPPVAIPGSELVVAVGHLYQRGAHRRRAAEILAGRTRRSLTARLGLPPTADARTVAEAGAARSGVTAAAIYAAIAPPDPTDDAALLALAQATDEVAAALSEPPAPTLENP